MEANERRSLERALAGGDAEHVSVFPGLAESEVLGNRKSVSAVDIAPCYILS